MKDNKQIVHINNFGIQLERGVGDWHKACEV